jgi:hypothetical protein
MIFAFERIKTLVKRLRGNDEKDAGLAF